MRCLGKIFLILLLLVAALVGYGLWQGPILDAQSKAYADNAVPAIFARWSKDQLLQRASPELTRNVSDNDLSTVFFGLARRLGVLVRCDGATGESHIFFNEKGMNVTAQYNVNAQFFTAPGVIQLSLKKHGDQWQLLGFHVNSRALLP